ncbi:c6 transcription [Moniliophthora roreri]|nr:c6 transcription [Moniliophthora roreri]
MKAVGLKLVLEAEGALEFGLGGGVFELFETWFRASLSLELIYDNSAAFKKYLENASVFTELSTLNLNCFKGAQGASIDPPFFRRSPPIPPGATLRIHFIATSSDFSNSGSWADSDIMSGLVWAAQYLGPSQVAFIGPIAIENIVHSRRKKNGFPEDIDTLQPSHSCDETKPICKKCYQRNLDCVQRSQNEHDQGRRQQKQQETTLCKPLTAPTPIPMDITSLQIMHHFTTATAASFLSDPSMYKDQRMRVVEPGFSENLQANSVEGLEHLRQIYDFRTPGLESEELFDPSIKAAYQKAVEALFIAYPLSQMGYETKCAVLWPTLFGTKFRDLLNERRQRALVVLYYYLGMLKSIGERTWWASEAGRCQDYVYGLLDAGWKGWVLQYDGSTKNYSIANSTRRLTY